MPHKNIKNVDIEKLKDLKDKHIKENNMAFTVSSIYEDLLNDRYLLRVVSTDDDFMQQYYISIYKKQMIGSLNWIQQPYLTEHQLLNSLYIKSLN